MLCRICEQRVSKRVMAEHNRSCLLISQCRLETKNCDAKLAKLSAMLAEKEAERRKLRELDKQLDVPNLPPSLTPLLLAGRLALSWAKSLVTPEEPRDPSLYRPERSSSDPDRRSRPGRSSSDPEMSSSIGLPDTRLLQQAHRELTAVDKCDPSAHDAAAACERSALKLKQIADQVLHGIRWDGMSGLAWRAYGHRNLCERALFLWVDVVHRSAARMRANRPLCVGA